MRSRTRRNTTDPRPRAKVRSKNKRVLYRKPRKLKKIEKIDAALVEEVVGMKTTKLGLSYLRQIPKKDYRDYPSHNPNTNHELDYNTWRKSGPIKVADVPRTGITRSQFADHMRFIMAMCFTKTECKVTNTIVWYAQHLDEAYPSAARIAKISGCGVTTVERTIAKLKYYRIIDRWFRPGNSSVYKMCDAFYDPIVRYKLRDLLPQLSLPHVVLLVALSLVTWGDVRPGGLVEQSPNGNLKKSNLESNRIGWRESLCVKNDIQTEKMSELVSKRTKRGDWCMDDNATGLSVGQDPVEKDVSFEQEASYQAQHMSSATFNRMGICQLSAFPEDALKYADERLSVIQGVRNPFTWCVTVAKNYCAQKQLDVDYGKAYRLQMSYAQADERPEGQMRIKTRIDSKRGNKEQQEKEQASKRAARLRSEGQRYYMSVEEKRKWLEENNESERLKFEHFKQSNPHLKRNLRRMGLKDDWNPFDPSTLDGRSPEQILLGQGMPAEDHPFSPESMKKVYDSYRKPSEPHNTPPFVAKSSGAIPKNDGVGGWSLHLEMPYINDESVWEEL